MSYPEHDPQRNWTVIPPEDRLSREESLGAGFVSGAMSAGGIIISATLLAERVLDTEIVNLPPKIESPLLYGSSLIATIGLCGHVLCLIAARYSDRE